jgi:hypothetical protein
VQKSAHLSYFGNTPLELSWTLTFQGTEQQAWDVFSNTHRMNRRVGMEVSYEQRHDPDGTPHRIGTMRTFGKEVTFEEEVFDYEAPLRIFIQRNFDEGPVSTYTLSIDIQTQDSGHTQIKYAVRWFPTNPATRILVRGLFPSVYGPAISRALSQIERALQEEDWREPEAARATLQPGAERIVRDLCSKLDNRQVAGLLQRLLLQGDDDDIHRIQVVSLARVWSLPLHGLLDSFLEAVSLGLLEIRWELLCPSCQGPSRRSVALDPDGLQGHCPSCNIAYDGNFADSLAATFCAPSNLRSNEAPVLCVGSPSWTPHILARAELPPRRTGSWTVNLPPGGYRLRELGSLQGAHLEVRHDAEVSEVVITLEEAGVRPLRLLVRSGTVRVFLKSRRGVLTRVVLEDRWRPRDVLTAGHLLERPRARELLPDEILPSDLSCVVRPVGILATEILAEVSTQQSALKALLGSLNPTQMLFGGSAVYSTWRDLGAALDAAARLEGAWQLFNSVSYGAVLELGIGEQRQPAGQALEDAAAALRSGLPGRSVLSERARTHPEVDSLLREQSPTIKLVPGPQLRARQDFLVEFLTEQPSPYLGPIERVLPRIDKLEGQVFAGRYLLGESLGSGGFGVVYGAQDQVTGEPAVVKLLRPELFSGKSSVQLFFREARAISLLDHPAIVSFKDFGHDAEGRLFLVMEHLAGNDLEQVLDREGVLAPDSAVNIAAGVLDGLEATHSAGLLHRDIKPSNVFLTTSGTDEHGVKLIDFGIAADQVEVQEDDTEGKIVGTLPFMATEQLRALGMGPSADLYGVGVMLWLMLTGKLPYPDLTPMQSALRRVQDGTPPLRSVRPEVPEAIAREIDRSLAKAPEDRHRSAAAMRQALAGSLG